MRIPSWLLAVLLVFVAPSGHAQSLRSVVVGHDVQVVVPPRGGAALPLVRAPANLPAPLLIPLPVAAAGMGLSAALPALLPVAAAILLGSGLPGSGGGGGAPATTR